MFGLKLFDYLRTKGYKPLPHSPLTVTLNPGLLMLWQLYGWKTYIEWLYHNIIIIYYIVLYSYLMLCNSSLLLDRVTAAVTTGKYYSSCDWLLLKRYWQVFYSILCIDYIIQSSAYKKLEPISCNSYLRELRQHRLVRNTIRSQHGYVYNYSFY